MLKHCRQTVATAEVSAESRLRHRYEIEEHKREHPTCQVIRQNLPPIRPSGREPELDTNVHLASM